MSIDVDFDIVAFKKQKEQLAKVATKQIADKIEEVKVLLKDIKDLAELSGVVADVKFLKYDVEAIEELHPDWNSSSYHC